MGKIAKEMRYSFKFGELYFHVKKRSKCNLENSNYIISLLHFFPFTKSLWLEAKWRNQQVLKGWEDTKRQSFDHSIKKREIH